MAEITSETKQEHGPSVAGYDNIGHALSNNCNGGAMKTLAVLLAAMLTVGCAWASQPTYTGRVRWSKLVEVPERNNPEYADGWSSLTVTCGTENDFEIAKSNGMMIWKRMRVLETIHGWKEKSTDRLPVVSRHYRYPLPTVFPPRNIPVSLFDTEPSNNFLSIAPPEPPDVPAILANTKVPCVQRSFRESDPHRSCRWFIEWREDFSECVSQATKYEATIYNEYFQSCTNEWTCADKSRVLLTAENGTKHCIKF